MTTTGGGDDGPGSFDDEELALVFDESFVRGAKVRELTAEDRVRRAQRIADQEAAAKAEEGRRKKQQQAARRARRPHRRLLSALPRPAQALKLGLVVGLIGLGLWYLSQDPSSTSGDENWASGSAAADVVVGDARPTPSPAKSMVRLSPRPYEPPKEGRFRFLETQDQSEAAVSYDPCRVIHVVINPRTMPPKANGLVEDALEELGKLTGLHFEVDGTTDEPSTDPRPSFQPDRYGDRWAPVLISWSDEEEAAELGANAGTARSEYVEARGRYVYVSGHVNLDGVDLGRILAVDAPDSTDFAKDVILHELGHLVGLDHVDDENELMFPEGRGERHGFGPGDRRGLYELGGGRCLEEI